jgi:hypothetical protein
MEIAMEMIAFAFVAVIGLITAYTLRKLFKFATKEHPVYEYKTVMDEQGNKYELVVDTNSNTKEKE